MPKGDIRLWIAQLSCCCHMATATYTQVQLPPHRCCCYCHSHMCFCCSYCHTHMCCCCYCHTHMCCCCCCPMLHHCYPATATPLLLPLLLPCRIQLAVDVQMPSAFNGVAGGAVYIGTPATATATATATAAPPPPLRPTLLPPLPPFPPICSDEGNHAEETHPE